MPIDYREQLSLGEQAGYLWTWWKNDPLPLLSPLPGWHIETPEDLALLAKIGEIPVQDVELRWQEGHRPFIAYQDATPVAYGWSALNNAVFGYPPVHFSVPANNLYLYDFVTQPLWRGHGFYPRLLQEILLSEGKACERFWIIHQLANFASQKGIARAGFRIAASVFHVNGGGLALIPDGNLELARVGADLLGLPLVGSR
ncbi:MAG TPA: GNAT family N-acetyltransferase [Ktedonosporobacter sp.]|nr:GNAT family N-acetyltransferase [Ktedonosporobacter sp.]